MSWKGGGGTVYATYLHSIDMLRKLPKGRMRVIDPMAIAENSRVVGEPALSACSDIANA